jgi:hypothetical protein
VPVPLSAKLWNTVCGVRSSNQTIGDWLNLQVFGANCACPPLRQAVLLEFLSSTFAHFRTTKNAKCPKAWESASFSFVPIDRAYAKTQVLPERR